MLADLIVKFAAVAFAMLALAAALNDTLTLRIPNLFCGAMVGCFALLLIGQGPQWNHLIAVALAALIFALGAFGFERGWMGGGDVKFLAAVSLWAGPQLLAPTLLLVALTGAVIALLAATPVWQVWRWVTVPLGGTWLSSSRHKTAVPYGPAIACGALFVAEKIIGLNWV